MRTTPSGLDAPTRNPGLDTVNNMLTSPPTQPLAPLSSRHRALMQPLAPLSGRDRALMQPLAPLSGRDRALMQPLAPLSAHNTPFQPFFTQQRRHRFQRPHTTNQQRCHWLRIPPVARKRGRISASIPVSAATPPSNTNYTRWPGQQPHNQNVNNMHISPPPQGLTCA